MAKVKPRQDTHQEGGASGIRLQVVLLRAGVGLIILVILFGLTRPEVLDRLEARLSSVGFDTHGGVTKSDAPLATLFAPQVMYWQDHIRQWALDYHLNPNLIATIIQIESCGDPYISSGAGAQGLFQVMPLHFEPGQNQLDPDINAEKGLNHLSDCLRNWSNYDVGLAFACYNGGPSVATLPQSQWYQESRDYYFWGSGIYGEASRGEKESTTLAQWFAAGGSQLCESAARTQSAYLP